MLKLSRITNSILHSKQLWQYERKSLFTDLLVAPILKFWIACPKFLMVKKLICIPVNGGSVMMPCIDAQPVFETTKGIIISQQEAKEHFQGQV